MSVVVVVGHPAFIGYITNPFDVFPSTYPTFSVYFSFCLTAATPYPLDRVRFLYG